MILNGKTHKMKLIIHDDFQMKHAITLLKYQTYLLYDVEIKLQSFGAYIAINYFFDSVTGKISSKFFRGVEAHISKVWALSYNKFIKHYLQRGFKQEKLNTFDISSYEQGQTQI